MDAAGVDVVAASIAPPMSHLDVDPELGLTVSRAINEAFAELADEYDGRVLPLGNVPLQDVDLAIGELRRITDDYGFKGVQVGSNIGGTNLGDESQFPFWEEVRERDLFVFSHGVNPMGADRLKEHQLHNFVGLPIDTAVSVGSMVFNGVYERLPGLKVCYSHGGGAFPCWSAAGITDTANGCQQSRRQSGCRATTSSTCTPTRSRMTRRRCGSWSNVSVRIRWCWAATIPSTWARRTRSAS